MCGKVKTLMLVSSMALNVPFIALWAANTMQPREKATPEAATLEPVSPGVSPRAPYPRGPAPRASFPGRPETTRSVYREIGATTEQWQEIEPRLAQFRESMSRLGRELKQDHDELVILVAATEPDDESIRVKQEEILEGHRRIEELVLENMMADKEILTPEQQAKFFKKLRDYCGRTGAGPMMGGRGPAQKFGPPPVSQRNKAE